jgi:transcriptional regulator
VASDERLLLHLRYWCDFSQAEIARHLGVTQQSVSYQERCILRKLKKLLNDIQKTEDKIAELQEHLKRQNTLRQQMEDIEIIKSFRSMKLDSRSLLVLLDGIQKGTVTIQMDEDGGITVEDAKAPQKKENNAEVHRPPVGQMTEREVLDDEE